MLKVIGKVFYFIFILLFLYIMYTYSNASLINAYYEDEVYIHQNNSSEMINALVIPFGDKYDSTPVYKATSTVEGKSFEINFFTFVATNNSPGLFITFNNLDFNHNDDLFLSVNFDVGLIPSGTYNFHFTNDTKSTDRHFIRIMLNYNEMDDYAYFTFRNNNELTQQLLINNFDFSYSLDDTDYIPFLKLKSIDNSTYDHSIDTFTSESNEPFNSSNFYGNADRFNLLGKDLDSVVNINAKQLTQYNYIIYRNMALSIIGIFLLTFIIFYRKLIMHWFNLLKQRKTNNIKQS